MKTLLTKVFLHDAMRPIRWLHATIELPDEKRVHATRVSIKRLQARLYLLEALDPDWPDTTHLVDSLEQLKDALSEHRDRDVLLKLLDDLLSLESTQAYQAILRRLRDILSASQTPAKHALPEIRLLAATILQDVSQLPQTEIRAKVVRTFLDKRFRKLCRKGGVVLATYDWDRLHKWRKRVKNLYYQDEVLAGGRPSLLPAGALDRFGKQLGKIHDLCLLENLIGEHGENRFSPDEVASIAPLRALLDSRRLRLLKQCRDLHNKVCAS